MVNAVPLERYRTGVRWCRQAGSSREEVGSDIWSVEFKCRDLDADPTGESLSAEVRRLLAAAVIAVSRTRKVVPVVENGRAGIDDSKIDRHPRRAMRAHCARSALARGAARLGACVARRDFCYDGPQCRRSRHATPRRSIDLRGLEAAWWGRSGVAASGRRHPRYEPARLGCGGIVRDGPGGGIVRDGPRSYRPGRDRLRLGSHDAGRRIWS